MKIKSLMDFLNKETVASHGEGAPRMSDKDAAPAHEENVVYIENARLETAREQQERKALLAGGTQWADEAMGEILISLGKIRREDIDQIIECQRQKGLYFGEAAVDLKLIDKEDVLQALSTQFGYSYERGEESMSREKVMAYSPFGEQAEEFRAIRGRLVNTWLRPEQKTLAIVSPENREGRSYVASNLALAFSQSGHSTLLIDGDMRSPRQHDIFKFSRRVGLSMLLAGRIRVEDLDVLPDQISNFQHLSVLGCGAVPPNPAELLARSAFPLILNELEKYFDVIIFDTPPSRYEADLVAIAAVARSALLVARAGHTKMEETKKLMGMLRDADAKVVGAVLNQF